MRMCFIVIRTGRSSDPLHCKYMKSHGLVGGPIIAMVGARLRTTPRLSDI